ncbi:hypothetical protein LPTSP4_18690 [Leptospira ryugenii]|uniref:Uncharacterized protein n=1 Tax=Leptospira ryugenii TaxID=1917863 RepID=A0A2P2E0D2_9LEPT|nr:DUF4865 family protein [Leptospira ryugenii]GBF50344.1 hypothetical protein LPTSP4_18690 [Leptospira ryugenii]
MKFKSTLLILFLGLSPIFADGMPGNTLDPKTAVLTWTRVNRPWYAVSFLIKSKMKDSIPEYKAIPGLALKSYSIETEQSSFGGIYIWKSEQAARDWFNPNWFARVKEKYGETEVPILPLVWMPKEEDFLRARESATYAKVFQIKSNLSPKTAKEWEEMTKSFQKEAGFLTAISAKQGIDDVLYFTFWKDRPEGKENESHIKLTKGSFLGICELPIQLSNLK